MGKGKWGDNIKKFTQMSNTVKGDNISTTTQKNNRLLMFFTNQECVPACRVFTWGYSIDGPFLSNDVLLQPPLQRESPPLFCLQLRLCLLKLVKWRERGFKTKLQTFLKINFLINTFLIFITSFYHRPIPPSGSTASARLATLANLVMFTFFQLSPLNSLLAPFIFLFVDSLGRTGR